MHSSGMRTARLLTVCQGVSARGVGCLLGGICPVGCLSRGKGCLPMGEGCLLRAGLPGGGGCLREIKTLGLRTRG